MVIQTFGLSEASTSFSSFSVLLMLNHEYGGKAPDEEDGEEMGLGQMKHSFLPSSDQNQTNSVTT